MQAHFRFRTSAPWSVLTFLRSSILSRCLRHRTEQQSHRNRPHVLHRYKETGPRKPRWASGNRWPGSDPIHIRTGRQVGLHKAWCDQLDVMSELDEPPGQMLRARTRLHTNRAWLRGRDKPHELWPAQLLLKERLASLVHAHDMKPCLTDVDAERCYIHDGLRK